MVEATQQRAVEQMAQHGISALQRGDFAAAQQAFAEVTRSPDASPQAWLLYAQACTGADDRPEALIALDRVLAGDPHNPFALLMKGDIYDREGDPRAAVSFYRMGVRRAASLPQMPADLASRVERASSSIAAAELQFNDRLTETLTARGIARFPPRFAEALAIASGQRVYLQRPTSFYYPGLPQQPWYPRETFPWLASFEAAVPAMRAEIEDVILGDAALEPYVQQQQTRPSRGHALLDDARWSAFHLWRDGSEVRANAERCPRIMQLLAQAPIPRISRRSPMALISILRPGTHIPPHHGMLNTRLICHVPLVVPAGCRLRVGAETRPVVAGEAMIFDDSFEHEAWNDGDSVRAVLLFEIWRPELDEAERTALTAMFEAVTGFAPAAAPARY